MATYTSLQYPSNSTDALFRAWVASVIAGITSVGIVQTADTGQINTATVLKPTGSSVSMGYAIFRFDDTLQATYPVFIKLVFGASNYSANNPSVGVTLGTATNGAGTLAGQVSSLTTGVGQNWMSSSDTVVTRPIFISGGTNHLQISLFHTIDNGIIHLIDRSHNNDGSVNGDGFFHISWGSSAGNCQFVPLVGSIPGTIRPQGPFNPNSTVVGTSVGVFPTYPLWGAALNPTLSRVVFRSGEISAEVVIPVTIYGASHSFLTLDSGADQGIQDSGNAKIAMRWE